MPGDDPVPYISDESTLTSLAFALGADTVPGISSIEKKLDSSRPIQRELVTLVQKAIVRGQDPLGDAFCRIRTAANRRTSGAVYTPLAIVNAMTAWSATIVIPDRVIDPGAGSGRFLLDAGRRFKRTHLVAVESDPLAALTTRANLAAAGMSGRAEVRLEDFRNTRLDDFDGRTLYVGNPPYVRHHLISSYWKKWLKREAEIMNLPASGLAGLHVYFFLAIARRARAGDFGALITAAEWLDVNYGQLVRRMFLERLGGQAVYLIEPKAEPFPSTATTGAITIFSVEDQPRSARFARVSSLSALQSLSGGRRVRRERLAVASRWSHFTRPAREMPSGYTELGELCRVHRGQVTGANQIWIAGEHSVGLPESVLVPTVTKARELIAAGWVLETDDTLRRVIDLPADLSVFKGSQLKSIGAFLKRAQRLGVRKSYTASHRKPWWCIGLREPAAILATYMARSAPSFALNRIEARHINIAHGLYPRERMSSRLKVQLVHYLRRFTSTTGGREYSGGLIKFEPREMERIPVPEPSHLLEMTFD